VARIIFRCMFCREEREAAVILERGDLLQVTCERGHTQFIRRSDAKARQ